MRRQCRGQPLRRKAQARSAWRDAETKARNSLSSSSVSNASQRSSSAELMGCAPGVCRISFSSGSRSSSVRSCSCSALVLVATTSVIVFATSVASRRWPRRVLTSRCPVNKFGPGPVPGTRSVVHPRTPAGHPIGDTHAASGPQSDRDGGELIPLPSSAARISTGTWGHMDACSRPQSAARQDDWRAETWRKHLIAATRMLWAVAWGQGQAAGVGEAEAGVAGGALGQGSGEHAGGGVASPAPNSSRAACPSASRPRSMCEAMVCRTGPTWR
jgi:hypothetical protein